MRLDRRRFLTAGTGALAVGSLSETAARATFGPRSEPGETITCALIGAGGRGTYLLDLALRIPDVAITTICDVDARRRARACSVVDRARGKAPRAEGDFRHVLDDPTIDAVIVATPHHWHTPIVVRALEAGKHVYVEKPASHVFQEGRRLVEAARKAGKVVQHGTQMRSSPLTAEAGRVLASGLLGEIVMAKAFGVEPRRDHPQPVPDEPPPAELDYATWLGPAPERPYNPGRVRRWNDYRDYGNGEIGGDGIHDIDLARWGLGAMTHPVRVVAHGSRVKLRGESDFPDNMVVVFEYEGGKVLVYENRNFAPYGERGFDNANVFHGTEGYMLFSRRGAFQTYLGAKEEKGPGARGSSGIEEHVGNFFDAIRSGGKTSIAADAEVAHLSCSLVHLGEIAYRTGRALRFDPKTETILGDDDAHARLTKPYRAPWGFDPA
ncbi:MAG: Gfo/Idh/MocA family protein [Isosphaeraceae bacterium]